MSAEKVGLGVVGVKSYSRHRQNDKALSAPFLCVGFRRGELSPSSSLKRND